MIPRPSLRHLPQILWSRLCDALMPLLFLIVCCFPFYVLATIIGGFVFAAWMVAR